MKCNHIRIIGIPEEEEKVQGIQTVFQKYDKKFPETGEEKNHAGSGSTEGPNQDEPKEAYRKIHHN